MTRAAVPTLTRPMPPEDLVEDLGIVPRFVPAPEIVEWARACFIVEGAPLVNPDHEHLRLARIGALWTAVPNRRQMRTVIATAEMPFFRGSRWVKARQEAQLIEWFGDVPDFLLTFWAPWAAEADDASWCATVEHELYHCGQQEDQWGSPKFRRDGTPVWAIRGHDAEEFVGVVRRYGVGAAASGVEALVRAAARPPEIAAAQIAGVCGTCLARVA